MTYLITGGAGFIGSNFVKHMLKTHDNAKLIVVDALTYAGNLGTLKDVLNDPRVTFVKADICNQQEIEQIFETYDIDHVVNFAAESHVDRSIENPQLFLEVNILGTQNMLNTAKKYWTTGKDENNYPIWKEGVKYLQVSTDEVYGSLDDEGFFTEETPLDPRSPYSASKTGGDLIVRAYAETYKMPINITRETYPSDYQKYSGRKIATGLWRWAQCERLALCGRPLQGHRQSAAQRQSWRGV